MRACLVKRFKIVRRATTYAKKPRKAAFPRLWITFCACTSFENVFHKVVSYLGDHRMRFLPAPP
jgi:hypothetical protein